jgi:hypothetical protein
MFEQVFSGLGLGAVVGLLIALSTEHVVGSVIAALTALLAGFFGLSSIATTNLGYRIGCFGFACIVGVLSGLMLRNGGSLLPNITEMVAEWTAAGYSPEEARTNVALLRLGIKPSGAEIVPPPAPISALFSADQASLCGRLENISASTDKIRLLKEKGGLYAGIAATAEASTDIDKSLSAGLKSICG